MSWSSPPHIPQRAEAVDYSSRTEPASPIRAYGASSTTSIYESSPGFDDALIEAEVHVNEFSKVASHSAEFRPLQELFNTPINIEFGADLNQKCIVHLELLKCYSKLVKDLFNSAEPYHLAYAQGRSLRQSVKALLWPKTPTNMFSGEKAADTVEKAMGLIIRCFDRFPLHEHQHSIREVLVQATTEVFTNKQMWKAPPSTGDLKKKEKDYHPVDQIRARLQVLKSEAIEHVIRRLNRILWIIKRTETQQMARQDHLKAAAQRRILLPSYDANTVGPFLQWIYQGKLCVDNATQLCELYELAEELGVTNLAQTCLSKLSAGAFHAIEQANSEGITLQTLIENSQQRLVTGSQGEAHDPLVGVVWTVFKFVLQNKEPPTELEHMVVEAIAGSADGELLAFLMPMMSHGILQQVAMALMSRLSCVKLVPKEKSKTESIKAEIPIPQKAESKN
ncbi:hypothetical protein K505DRAFT_333838 [Melanomma pulvis-pyrius CBS 109.77]|uniref:BTB domain-containing protein n=1 Tax=Melanomma pulvis-pyrius CBS 109.77 TaxID=1314802 RepID=A0A6A6XP47_9PLEO|nr:hypothetical protein K505DRAFT_333838 [Melanomma pulvis-pyrius CBS 109.77]